MSLARLTKKLIALNTLEAELGASEQNAVKLLSVAQSEFDPQKIEQLTILVESVTSLRRLIHKQIKGLLIDLQQQMKTGALKSSKVKSEQLAQESNQQNEQVSKVQEEIQFNKQHNEAPKARLESNPQTPQPLKLSQSPKEVKPEINEPLPQASSQGSSPPFDLDETPDIQKVYQKDQVSDQEITPRLDSEHEDFNEFDDLEELKRGVEFLTQPNFAQDDLLPSDFVPTLQSAHVEVLPFDLPPLPTLEPVLPQNKKGEAKTEEELNHKQVEKSVGPSESSSSPEKMDFNFPMSSGEAGTAIFDETMLEKQQPDSVGTAVPPQPQLQLPIHMSTPTKAGRGSIRKLDVKEIEVLSSVELLRGEEVRLKFILPKSQEAIDCRGLVRSNATEQDQPYLISLRFLDLRPAQEKLIQDELT